MTKESPAIRVPQQKRSEETRERIIKAGILLFSRDGYHATSSKKIAREAKVAVGSFYNYFEDKKQLLFEIHRQHADRVHAMIARALADVDFSQDGRAMTQKIVRHTLELHDLSPDLHRQIASLVYTDPDFAKMGEEEENRAVQSLIKLLEPQRAALRVTDLEAAAQIIAHSMEAVVHSIKIFGSSIEQERLTDALGDMIFRYLYN